MRFVYHYAEIKKIIYESVTVERSCVQLIASCEQAVSSRRWSGKLLVDDRISIQMGSAISKAWFCFDKHFVNKRPVLVTFPRN